MSEKKALNDKELETVNGGYTINTDYLFSNGIIRIVLGANENRQAAVNQATTDFGSLLESQSDLTTISNAILNSTKLNFTITLSINFTTYKASVISVVAED